MKRNLKICLLGAVLCHVLVLVCFTASPSRLAQVRQDTAVEVALIAVPSSAEPEPSEPLPDVPPPEPKPPEPAAPDITPAKLLPMEPEPPPVAIANPEPVAPPPAPISADSSLMTSAENLQPVTRADDDPPSAASEKSAVAKYRHNPKPAYPLTSRRKHEEGVVVLLVKVSAEGKVLAVELKNSSGFSALDQSALAAVRRWEFEPARLGSQTVESMLAVPVRFKLGK